MNERRRIAKWTAKQKLFPLFFDTLNKDGNHWYQVDEWERVTWHAMMIDPQETKGKGRTLLSFIDWFVFPLSIMMGMRGSFSLVCRDRRRWLDVTMTLFWWERELRNKVCLMFLSWGLSFFGRKNMMATITLDDTVNWGSWREWSHFLFRLWISLNLFSLALMSVPW